MKTKTIRRITYSIAASASRFPTEAEALAAIIGSIERFWHRKDIKLIPLDPGLSWQVQLGEILHDTARVIRQGRHYYFAFTA